MVVTYTARGIYTDPSTNISYNTDSVCTISTANTVLAGNVSINSTLPDMKVGDFFSGVLKEFNATCVATS